jgi:DNA-binding transcriptional regulator YdaS (Cro superfamily)
MELAAKRLTQAALAEHLGVNPATVNHWIKGRRKLTIEDVARIAVEALRAGRARPAEEALPVYLRNDVASTARHSSR